MDKKQVITACVFLHKNSKVLIAKRADTKTFLPGVWELVGGHIEFGETVIEGLKREVKEELNIEVQISRPYYEFTYVTDDKLEHVVEIEYLATLKDPNQEIVVKPDDHSDFAWITEDEIEKYFSGNNLEGNALKKGFKAIKS